MQPDIILAPLEGVTEKPYRTCFYDHFPGLTASLTPFLSIPDRVQKVYPRNLAPVSAPGESLVPEIPQILVSEISAFQRIGSALRDRGFTEMNWNLGCPSRGVVNKKKGSGLMPYPDQICSILDEALGNLDMDLSIKLRSGLHSEKELYALLPRLSQYPIKNLIIHPRLGTQMYMGTVHLDHFDKAIKEYKAPVTYNGDIKTLSDYRTLQKRFPEIKQWMIGRGLLANPFLLENILESRVEESAIVNPYREDRYYHFLDDLILRLKTQFHKEKSMWNFFKGIMIYSFKSQDFFEEFKQVFFAMECKSDWDRLQDKIRLKLES